MPIKLICSKQNMSTLPRVFCFLAALVPLVAMNVDLANGHHDTVDYFSTFTILANILASSVFAYFSLWGLGQKNPAFDSIRGATLGYLIVAGTVYYFLLRNLPEDPGTPVIPLVNYAFHYFTPIAMLANWLIFPPNVRLKLTESFKWLAFPLLFAIYTLIRGTMVHWYPYPFLDPSNGGYLRVLIFSVVMIILGLALSVFLILIGNKLRDFRN